MVLMKVLLVKYGPVEGTDQGWWGTSGPATSGKPQAPTARAEGTQKETESWSTVGAGDWDHCPVGLQAWRDTPTAETQWIEN